MGALKGGAFAAALALAAPVTASPVAVWRPLIAEASARFQVPEEWIARVMRAESGGRTHLRGAPTTSRAGAMGLMQVMPGTYAALAAEHGLGPDPHHPRDNILAGTAYLRSMYDRFGYPGLFAAYNAGPKRYEQHLVHRRPLPLETRAYVAALTGPASSLRMDLKAPPGAPEEKVVEQRLPNLFFELSPQGDPASDVAAPAAGAGLFVSLRPRSG